MTINDGRGFEEFVNKGAIKQIIHDPIHCLAYEGPLIGAFLVIEDVIEFRKEIFSLGEQVHLEMHPTSAIRASVVAAQSWHFCISMNKLAKNLKIFKKVDQIRS